MSYARLVLATCALLWSAAGLTAQQTRPQHRDTASKSAVRRAAQSVQPDMAVHCSAVVSLQNASFETASRAQRLARARRLNRPAIQAQAEASLNDVQSLLRELAAMEPSANTEQKAVIASLLVYDRQAEQQATELVKAAQTSTSQGTEIASHAEAEMKPLHEASYALHTDPNTGQATGQKRAVLCTAAPVIGVRRPTPPIVHTGQASGKRQY